VQAWKEDYPWLQVAFKNWGGDWRAASESWRVRIEDELDAALEVLGRGSIELATTRLDRLDEALAARPGTAALRARASILAMIEVLTQHAAYFGAGEPA